MYKRPNEHIAVAREMIVHTRHPVMGDIVLNGNPVKLSETKTGIERPSPVLGSDNEEVYGGILGYSDLELEALREEGVI